MIKQSLFRLMSVMFGFGLIYCYASPELNHFEIKG